MEKFQFSQLRFFTGLLVLLLVVGSGLTASAQKNDRSVFIYGEIETIDNTYRGFIRWGKEEAFWFDYFNASKTSKEYSHSTPEKENKKSNWLDIDWNLSSIWEDKSYQGRHEFTCQFGDISELRIIGSNKALVILKNGVELKVDGSGYNDLGGSVSIYDEEIGKINLRWSKLNKITFKSGENTSGQTFGEPIFGTVKTYRKGDFTGYIQWDHDERVSSDMLDGDSNDGDVSIAFGKIKVINKSGKGSRVTLNSGREFELVNSNDVNSGNRGIIVMADGVGEIDIPWKDFESVTFIQPSKGSRFAYDDYTTPSGIRGKVFLHDNTSLSGKIIYDLDEVWEAETLEADDDNISYRIPFRNIRKIEPKNYDYSLITLKNDQVLLLGGKRDVSDSNDGLLVIEKGSSKPRYIPWKNVSEIILD